MTIPVGYAQVNWICGGTSLPTGAQFTLGLDLSGYSGDIQTLAGILGDCYDDDIAPSVSDGFGLTDVLVKYGPDETGQSWLQPYVANGEHAGVGAPPNTAYLIQKQTTMGGRAGRGRMYIPGVPEASITSSGVLDSTLRTDLGSGLDNLVGTLAVAGVVPVVLHQPGSPLVIPTEITALTVSPVVATQRQRLRR